MAGLLLNTVAHVEEGARFFRVRVTAAVLFLTAWYVSILVPRLLLLLLGFFLLNYGVARVGWRRLLTVGCLYLSELIVDGELVKGVGLVWLQEASVVLDLMGVTVRTRYNVIGPVLGHLEGVHYFERVARQINSIGGWGAFRLLHVSKGVSEGGLLIVIICCCTCPKLWRLGHNNSD
jgi:hypothetical protein